MNAEQMTFKNVAEGFQPFQRVKFNQRFLGCSDVESTSYLHSIGKIIGFTFDGCLVIDFGIGSKLPNIIHPGNLEKAQ